MPDLRWWMLRLVRRASSDIESWPVRGGAQRADRIPHRREPGRCRHRVRRHFRRWRQYRRASASPSTENGVLSPDAVHAQIRGKIDVAFLEVGALELKNIAVPARAWRRLKAMRRDFTITAWAKTQLAA